MEERKENGFQEENRTDCMGWNDEIDSDGQEYVVVPEGDYCFRVLDVERGSFPGGKKIPACNKATVTLAIENDLGIATAREDLLLHRTVIWKLAAFFRSIGMKERGQRVKMDFEGAVGRRGRAHFVVNEYRGRYGTRQINDVDRFLDWDPAAMMTEATVDELPWDSAV